MINEAQLFLEIDNTTFQKDLKQDWYEIDETSLRRIMGEYKEISFIIISAQRTFEGDNNGKKPTPEEEVLQIRKNRKNDELLKQKLSASQFGYVPVLGGYREKGVDGPNKEISYIVASKEVQKNKTFAPPGGKTQTTSLSPGQHKQQIHQSNIQLAKLAKILCAGFNQDAFLYKPSDLYDQQAYLIDRDGKILKTFSGELTANDLSQEYFTQLRKRAHERFSFTENPVFESYFYIRNPPEGMDRAMNRSPERFFNKEWGLGIKK